VRNHQAVLCSAPSSTAELLTVLLGEEGQILRVRCYGQVKLQGGGARNGGITSAVKEVQFGSAHVADGQEWPKTELRGGRLDGVERC
jgi:hypothetical protein